MTLKRKMSNCVEINSLLIVFSASGENRTQFHVFIWDEFHCTPTPMLYNLLHQTTVLDNNVLLECRQLNFTMRFDKNHVVTVGIFFNKLVVSIT